MLDTLLALLVMICSIAAAQLAPDKTLRRGLAIAAAIICTPWLIIEALNWRQARAEYRAANPTFAEWSARLERDRAIIRDAQARADAAKDDATAKSWQRAMLDLRSDLATPQHVRRALHNYMTATKDLPHPSAVDVLDPGLVSVAMIGADSDPAGTAARLNVRLDHLLAPRAPK